MNSTGNDPLNDKFSPKDYLLIIYAIIVYAVVCAAIIVPILWIISKCIPWLIGAIVFVPWLCSALKNGAKV